MNSNYPPGVSGNEPEIVGGDESQVIRFCVCKTIRSHEGTVFNHVPYSLFGEAPKNRYQELRSQSYSTIEEAKAAALECNLYNPVVLGHSVCIVDPSYVFQGEDEIRSLEHPERSGQ